MNREKIEDERKYQIIASSVIVGVVVIAIASYLYLCRTCF